MNKWLDKVNINTEEPDEEEYDVKNDEWLKRNYLELIQDYPNMWIAVWEQRVVSTGTSRNQVETKAKKLMGERRYSCYFIDPANVEVGLS